MVIKGVHAMLYSSQPAELRAFLADKLGLSSFDIGGGWLVFDLPGAEVGVHGIDMDKGRPSGSHLVSFYCDDIQATVTELSAKGVEFVGGVAETEWGLAVRFKAPGGIELDLYQPLYESPF